MIIDTCPIPTKFQKLDTNVNSDDSFANTRDLNILRNNHNILIAEGIKKNILTQAFQSPFKTYSTQSIATNQPIFEIPLLVSQYTQYLTVKVRVCRGYIGTGDNVGTAVSPYLYFVAHKTGQRREYDKGLSLEITTDYTETESDLGNFSGDIPIPMQPINENYYGGLQSYILGMYAKCQVITDAGYKGGGKVLDDITGIGQDWFEVPNNGMYGDWCLNYMAFFDDLTISPRQIVRFDEVVAGTTDRYYVDPPFDRLPQIDTEPGVTALIVQGANIYSINIYEKVVTDFGEVHGEI